MRKISSHLNFKQTLLGNGQITTTTTTHISLDKVSSKVDKIPYFPKIDR